MSHKLSHDPSGRPGAPGGSREAAGERRGDLLGAQPGPSQPTAAGGRPPGASSSSSAWPTTPARTAPPRSRRWPRWSATPGRPSAQCALAWTGCKSTASSRPAIPGIVAARSSAPTGRHKAGPEPRHDPRAPLPRPASQRRSTSSPALPPGSRPPHRRALMRGPAGCGQRTPRPATASPWIRCPVRRSRRTSWGP
jgi:hypothetical protein